MEGLQRRRRETPGTWRGEEPGPRVGADLSCLFTKFYNFFGSEILYLWGFLVLFIFHVQRTYAGNDSIINGLVNFSVT